MEGRPRSLGGAEGFRSSYVFMTLLLYCDRNLVKTLILFDKCIFQSCHAQQPVVRGGQMSVNDLTAAQILCRVQDN